MVCVAARRVSGGTGEWWVVGWRTWDGVTFIVCNVLVMVIAGRVGLGVVQMGNPEKPPR